MILAPYLPLCFFTFLLVLFPSVHAQQVLTSDPHSAANTLNNNPQFTNNSPTISPTFSPQFITTTTSTIHAIGIKVGDIVILISQTMKEIVTKDNWNLLKDLIKQLIWQYRYKIAGGTAIGSYSAMSILLIADYHQLDNNMIWPRWKHKLTFEDLCAIPQKELAKELMLAIGQHHYNKTNPTDLAYPLIAFIKEIDWEIDTIKRYIKTTKIIKSLSLMKLFPTNERKLNQATKMLERVLFIKHIFLSWLADYNLTSAEKLNC
jgi:hypothetical protein